MRLIDADALKTKAIKCETFKLTDTPVFFKAVGTNEIDKAPTIDAVEVVHGHWVQRWTGNECIVFCSKCRTEATEIVDYELEYNYCPNCGAKMDEVADEET